MRFACTLLGWLLLLLSPAVMAVAEEAGWKVEAEGGFARNTGAIDPEGHARLGGRVALWDSWQGDDAKSGRVRFGPLKLGTAFQAYVLGFPNDTTLTFGWEDESGRRQLLLTRHAPEHKWMLGRWAVPEEWQGRSVWFFAEDRAATGYGWLGVSEPVVAATPSPSLPRLLGWHALLFALVLAPGAAIALWTWRPGGGAERMLAVAMVASGLLAYVCYFAYYWSPSAGRAMSWTVLVLGLVGLVSGLRRRGVVAVGRTAVAPLGVVFAASLMYLAVLLLYGGGESPEMVPLDRMLVRMPPDTALPMWVADMMAAGRRPVGFLGDWLSSDRPPLQSGFYLLVHPVAAGGLGYQILGVILQCWVFAGMWIAGRAFGIAPRALAWVLFGAVFSGFFVFNGTFVWPKLLPAGYLLIVLAGLGAGQAGWAALTGAAAGLAMMGHGGSAFALFGLGVFTLLRPPPRRWVAWGTIAVVGVLVLLPWSLYQKLADPPGNRLLKWHLAGAVPVDPRPLGQTLREAYAAKSWPEILRDRWTNVVMLVHRDETPFLGGFHNAWKSGGHFGAEVGWRSAVYHARELTFFHVFHSAQAWLAGIVGAWWLWCGRKGRWSVEWKVARLALGLVAAVALFWCALMFEAGSTGNHQGSYFTNACWFLFLGLGVAALPRGLRFIVAGLHLAVFAGVWVHAFPHSHHVGARFPTWEPAQLWVILAAAAGALWAMRAIGRASTL